MGESITFEDPLKLDTKLWDTAVWQIRFHDLVIRKASLMLNMNQQYLQQTHFHWSFNNSRRPYKQKHKET